MENVELCRLCKDNLPKKNRRHIFSEVFTLMSQLEEISGYVPRKGDGLSQHVCYKCFSKLNKLSKIDFDLQNRLRVLQGEKVSIITEFRKNMQQPAAHHFVQTPTKAGKRMIIHTPTPRKPKRPMVLTPVKAIPPPSRKRLAIGGMMSPDKVKVTGIQSINDRD